MSPSNFISNKNISNEKNLKMNDMQEYYMPNNKWIQPRTINNNDQPQRNQSTDILQNDTSINKSFKMKHQADNGMNQILNPNKNQQYSSKIENNMFDYNNNSRIKMKKYENSGNILEWQESSKPKIGVKNQLIEPHEKFIQNKNFDFAKLTPNLSDNHQKQYNYEDERVTKNINKETYENKIINNKSSHNINAIPESREKFTKTNQQEYEKSLNTIKNIEKNLMMAQMQKEKVDNLFIYYYH